MTALMRSANSLTPFDFPTTSASVLPAVVAHPASNGTSASQCSQASMQPIPATQLAQFSDVEMVVSRGALGGWVEQASPACGAASVAGAWNAVKPAGKLPQTSTQDVLMQVPLCYLFTVVVSLLWLCHYCASEWSIHPAKVESRPACICIRICSCSCSCLCLCLCMCICICRHAASHQPGIARICTKQEKLQIHVAEIIPVDGICMVQKLPAPAKRMC